MKTRLVFLLCSILAAGSSLGESRTFTNKDGKTLSASLVRVEGEKAILKLANNARVGVLLATLSDSDQEFIKTWWDENKNNVTDMDVRLSIEKKVDRIERPSDKKDKNDKGARKTVDRVEYHCELKSYTPRELTGITADYTIYKRITVRNKEGSTTTTETTEGSETIATLPGNQSMRFESSSIDCEDVLIRAISNQKNGKGGNAQLTSSKRETPVGIVVTLSANGQEIMQQSYPEALIGKLKEDEERE